MTPREVQKAIEEEIEKNVAKFDRRAQAAQKELWRQLFDLIKRLETDASGNIKPSGANLKKLRGIRKTLVRVIKTKGYKLGVSTFLATFDRVKNASDKNFRSLDQKHNPNKAKYKANLALAKNATKVSLLSSGIDEAVIKPVENLLRQNITAGGSAADLAAALQGEILGTGDKQGRLARYANQITRDALNQFNANHTQSAAADLGLEFYTYQGAIQTNSREYCKKRVDEGRWFHKREIEETAREEWGGKIPGTNASNILINRGGYNCQHQYLPVSILAVPKEVIERARAKGYIK